MQELRFYDYILSVPFSEHEDASERRKAEDCAFPGRELFPG